MRPTTWRLAIVSIDSGHGWFGAGLVERREGYKLVVAIRSWEDLPVERDEPRLAEFAAWRAEQGRRWDAQHADGDRRADCRLPVPL